MVNGAVKQARESFARVIKENPTTVRFAIFPTKDNGDGVQIPDYSKQFSVSDPEVIRISHEQGSIGKREENIGMNTNQTMFVEMFHDTKITEGSLICDGNGNSWTVGPLGAVSVFGSLIGYHAPIAVGSASRTRDILSITVGEYEATSTGNDYTIAVPAETDLSSLLPAFSFADHCAVFPDTAQDFTDPVEYTIYSESLETRKIKLSIVGSL